MNIFIILSFYNTVIVKIGELWSETKFFFAKNFFVDLLFFFEPERKVF
jgi:hypothetical protein